MAVEFDGSNDILDFEGALNVGGEQMTMAVWVKPGEQYGRSVMRHLDGTGCRLIWGQNSPSSAKVQFIPVFGSIKIWVTTDPTTANVVHHFAVTYDASDPSNDALIYIDGASVSVDTGGDIPTGTYTPGEGILLGMRRDGQTPFQGTIYEARYYNRILTAAEIAEIYSARRIDDGVARDGLVFHAPLLGAAGLQTFDGAMLGASNVVKDRIAGVAGTPSGNPVGRADTVIGYGGL